MASLSGKFPYKAPLVNPVALVRSARVVPSNPLELNKGAVFSIIYCRVRSAFAMAAKIVKEIKIYRSVYFSWMFEDLFHQHPLLSRPGEGKLLLVFPHHQFPYLNLCAGEI